MERRMFGSDQLAIASRFFRCLRMDAEAIASRDERKRYAPAVPTFLMLDGKGDVVARSRGPTTPAALVQKLGRAFSARYGRNLMRSVKVLDRQLARMEQMEDALFSARKRLSDLEARLAIKQSSRVRARIARAKEHIQAAQKELEQLEAARDAVLQVTPAAVASGRR